MIYQIILGSTNVETKYGILNSHIMCILRFLSQTILVKRFDTVAKTSGRVGKLRLRQIKIFFKTTSIHIRKWARGLSKRVCV